MGDARKAVVLSSVHSPVDTRIVQREIKSLVQAGYRVVYIVPAGGQEQGNGFEIRPLPKPSSRPRRMTVTTSQVFFAALAEKGDVYHFHDPELLPVGMALRVLGKRVIYDAHEDVPAATLTKHYLHPWARSALARVVGALELGFARTLSGVIAATPSIAERFGGLRTEIVQNFPLFEEVHTEGVEYALREPVVAYTGSISELRGIREMLSAVHQVNKKLPLTLEIAGWFSSSQLETELRESDAWSRVRFHGRIGYDEVQKLHGRARIGLVVFHEAPNHVRAQPNKLFEYMGAGIPVIASDFPLWRGLVEGEKCGLLVDPKDAGAIARAIEYLLSNPEEAREMGENGRRAVEQRYNWAREADKLIRMYDAVAGERGSP